MEARGSRSVGAGRDIGWAITGDNNRVTLVTSARSAYPDRVRDLAPDELVDRARELAELAEFCTADAGPWYAWWRAGAWAGKTALLSWFVLHPPQGIRVVPFFVTARLGDHNDVRAYIDVVLEQLAELVGEALPANLWESTREAHLQRLYREATRVCAERGDRLVLLVDGLDEDRGVTTGANARSIAALLPLRPVPGMRVLVSGRLNPSLPVDVPDHHPLRDPRIVRLLEPSRSALAIRAEAERELKHLIEAGGLEYDLLALVTAAGGGLSTDDLSELTGAVPYRVGDLLRTRAGRTFGMRAGVCLLAHEELQTQAERMLGRRELGRYRAELDAWADDWRGRGWPQGTPGYLLRGYFRSVRATGDVGRLVDLALDEARHDRMLEITGSDAAALAEIRDAVGRVAAEPPTDLLVLLRLAVRRTRLRERNENISVALCRAWAELGRAEKAVALARAVPDPRLRVSALVGVVRALMAGGDRRFALEALGDAEREAYRNILFDAWETFGEVLRLLAEFGPETRERADRLAERIVAATATDTETGLLLDVAGYWAATGRSARAEELARSDRMGASRAAALARIALALANEGEGARAEELFEEARSLAVTDTIASTLADLLGRAGEFARAEALIAAAFKDRRPADAPVLCARMVSLCVREGELDRAREWARRIRRPDWWRDYAEAEAACALARHGRIDEARACADAMPNGSGAYTDVVLAIVEAEAAAGRYQGLAATTPSAVRDALIRGAVRHARSGHRGAAERFLLDAEAAMRAALPAEDQVWELTQVAEDLRVAGHVPAARALLHDVEALLPPRPATHAQSDEASGYDSLVARVAEQLSAAGELRRAETLLLTTFHPFECEAAWRALLCGLIEADDQDRIRILNALLRSDRPLLDRLCAAIVRKQAAIGRIPVAELIKAFDGLPWTTVATQAEALAVTGRRKRARDLLAHLGSPATVSLYRAYRAMGDDIRAAIVLEQLEVKAVHRRDLADDLLAALVDTAWYDQAEQLAAKLTEEAPDTLVQLLVTAGQSARAARLAGLDAGPDQVSPAAAVALAPVVDPALGRELVVRLLLGEGSWLDVLPAVVRLDPRAVPWIVDELRTPTEARTSAPSWR